MIGDLAPLAFMACAVVLYGIDPDLWRALFGKEQIAEHLTHVAWLLLAVRFFRLARALLKPQSMQVWAMTGFCALMVLEETSYFSVYVEWWASQGGAPTPLLASAEALHNSTLGVVAQLLFMLGVAALAAGEPRLWRWAGRWVPLSRLALAALALVFVSQFLAEAWLPYSTAAVGAHARPGGQFDEVFDLGLCWAFCWAARPAAMARWLGP